jgi:hypothetical protein
MVTRYGSETITGALAIQAASTTGSGALSAALLISTTVNAKAIGIQAATNQGADLVSVMDRGGNTLLRVGGAGALQNYGSYAWFGGLQTPTVVNVTNVGTAGTTTYGYRIAATSATGVNTVASSTASTTTGNATLDTTNYNTVTWTGIVGASSYQIYGRTAGAELFIATVQGDGRATSYTWNDQGTVVTPAGALPSATGSTTLTVQGWNSQAANLAEFKDSAGNVISSVTSTGMVQTWVASVGAAALKLGSAPGSPNAPAIDLTGYGNATSGAGSLVRIVNKNITGSPVQVALAGATGALITSGAIGSVAIAARGITGQTANIQEWQDPTGASALAYVTGTGTIYGPTLFTQALKDPTTLSGTLNMSTAGYGVDLRTQTAANIALGIRGTAGQTGDLTSWRDPTGNTVLARVTAAGMLTLAGQMQSSGVATQAFTLATPTISSVAAVGTTGATQYTYRVTAVNGAGQTGPSAAVTITNGIASLSVTNYNAVTWNAVAGATSYRVYGRTAGAESFLATVTGGTTFNDQTLEGAAAAAGFNPLPNSSLNVGTINWANANTTFARDLTVAPPLPNVVAGLVTSTAASGGVNVQLPNTLLGSLRQYVAVTPSTQYTASAYILMGTAQQVVVGFQWFDSAGAYISGAGGTATGVNTTSWVRCSTTATVPATAFYVNVYIGLTVNAVGQTLWVAAPQIDAGPVALPYVLDLPQQTGGIYEGTARVYSPNNPPPATAASSVPFASMVKFGALA